MDVANITKIIRIAKVVNANYPIFNAKRLSLTFLSKCGHKILPKFLMLSML